MRRAALHSQRLAGHLYQLATTAAAGKEVRVTGIGPRLVADRRASWERFYGPVARTRTVSAAWHTLGWLVFGLGFVGAVVYVAVGLARPAPEVVLVLAERGRGVVQTARRPVEVAVDEGPGGLRDACLIRPSALTHQINTEQRYIGLGPAAPGVFVSPPNANVAPPGWYLLFVVNRAGTPSLGHWLQLG